MRLALSLRMVLGIAALSWALSWAWLAPPVRADSTAATPVLVRTPSESAELARAHFDRGVVLFDREQWQAALAEFLLSRELFETKTNTKNAAICLRKVERYEEALTLFEHLLSLPDLVASERDMVRRELAELGKSVGHLQLQPLPDGALVSLDGVARAVAPSGLLRVSAGSHQLRVTVEGSLPFETRFDVVGLQTVTVHVSLVPLTLAGRLRVVSRDARRLQLWIDGEYVGATPWEGALSPGLHALRASGEGALGTAPQRVQVERDTLRELALTAVELAGPVELRVEPREAEVTIDHVPIGRGGFSGGLLAGPHQIVVEAHGYQRATYELDLTGRALRQVVVKLQPLHHAQAHIGLDLRGGVVLGPLWGGELRDECEGGCAAKMPWGGLVLMHARYEIPSAFGIGVHAGYLGMSDRVSHRSTTVKPVGLAPNAGQVDDLMAWRGMLVGADAEYRLRAAWTLVLAVRVGALLGSVHDHRVGSFKDSSGNAYAVDLHGRSNARYLYVGPEARIERQLIRGLSLSLGLQLFVCAALQAPRWQSEETDVLVGDDGLGYFDTRSLAGRTLLLAAPMLVLSYDF